LPAERKHSLTLVLVGLGPSGWATAAIEFVARALIPASLLATAHGAPRDAWVLALLTQALVLLRSLTLGRALERELLSVWARLVDAGARHSIGFLRARDRELNPSLLVFAAQRTAQVRATTAPRLVADALGLATTAIAVVFLLGPTWLGLGVAVALALAPFVLVASGRVRRAELQGHEELSALVEDCGLLLDGATELRAHGLTAWAQRRALEHASLVAGARRRATAWRALLGFFPVAAALVAATVPGVRAWIASGTQLASLAILGATAVAFGLGFVGALEEILSAAPQRVLYERFVDAPKPTALQLSRAERPAGWLRFEPLSFEAVSILHSESAERTPLRFEHRWTTTKGLALTGPNGSGKTSLVNALFGLVPLESGAIRTGDAPWSEDRAAELRAHVAYVPQRPFVASSRSVGWHLRLLSEDASDDEVLVALEAVGLLATLRARAPEQPLSVTVGTLSGGELARMHLARIVLPRAGRPPDLVVVDEPEAGLDVAGRATARSFLARVAETTPVLVIAHDESIVPEGFERACCARGA